MVAAEMERAGELGAALGRLGVVRLEVELVPEEPSRLPRFLGSTLRGAIAERLRAQSCTELGRSRCEGCSRGSVRAGTDPSSDKATRCAYAYLFESRLPEDAPAIRGQRHLPHPLVIEPPALARWQGETRSGRPANAGHGSWAPADRLVFGLTLLGQAARWQTALCCALERLMLYGPDGRRHPFRAESLHGMAVDGSRRRLRLGRLDEDRSLEDGSQRPVTVREAPVFRLQTAAEALDGPVVKGVRIRLETPTRLVRNGRLTRRPDFATVVQALLRRATALLRFYEGVELAIDFGRLLELARRVETGWGSLRLAPLTRRSSRQGRRVPLDGMVGVQEYEGEDVRELVPLLRAGEVLHVGKGTIFGLGKMTPSFIV